MAQHSIARWRRAAVLLAVIGLMLVGCDGNGDTTVDAPDTTGRTTDTARTVTTDTTETVTTETTEKPPPACHPAYRGACVPASPPGGDVNCTQIPDTDFRSVGDDPYGLDGNGDGIACESP